MKESKEHILQTSLKLFLQKSFKDVTMREIVQESGMSKGAFYHYFKSKEEVFREVLTYFFTEITEDFSTVPTDSLYEFIQYVLRNMELKAKSTKAVLASDGASFSVNHYYLIFDALKMLPDFKVLVQTQQEKELQAWIDVCRIARERGEIKTSMTDTELGELFMYSGDGLGISLIIKDNLIPQMKMEVGRIWMGLYGAIKK